LPRSGPQALRHHQVVLRVQGPQRGPRAGHRGVLSFTLKVTQLPQHIAALVEHTRNGSRGTRNLAHHAVAIALGTEVPLGPSGMLLAVGARMARMALQLGAQHLDLLLLARSSAVTACG